jgi:hypothetical protein
MARTILRDLVLPSALTVTTFAIVMACGGDDDETGKSSGAVVACAELQSGDCKKCEDDQGKAKCGPSKSCYATANGGCTTGGSS